LALSEQLRHIDAMVEPGDQKHRYDFARLLTQIEELRSRAVQEYAKRLTPEQHKKIVDSLRDVLNKLTGRKS
jgi:Spy/CpxP family protein refolding chaperone